MRPTRQQMFIEIAHAVAKRATCLRLNVGAIIVQGNRVVSIGYNGQRPGEAHCTKLCKPGECDTIHAEVNALRYLSFEDRSEALDLYVTDSPCPMCAREIWGHKIKRVFFQSPYRLADPIFWLLERDIEVYRVLPNGMVISQRTNELVGDDFR